MRFRRLLIAALAAAVLCGCTPQTPPEPEAVTPPKDVYEVEVDWSKLPEAMPLFPDLDAGRWYAEETNELIPGNYGSLYPYVGTTVVRTGTWIDETGTEHTWTDGWGTPVYGLMTREGKVVTDPVYQGVYRPIYRYGSEVTALPVLLLSRSEPEWASDPGGNGLRYAVAAPDGSWCTEFEFWTYGLRGTSLLLAGPSGVTRLDVGSTPTRSWHWSWEELDISTGKLDETMDTIIWFYGFQWTQEGAFLGLTDLDDLENTAVRVFDPDSGGISYFSRQQWEEILNEHQQHDWAARENWTHTLDEDGVTLTCGAQEYRLPRPPGINTLHNVDASGDLVILCDYSANGGYWLYHLSTGALLTHQTNYIGFLQDSSSPDAPAYVWVNAGQEGHTVYASDFTLIAAFPEDAGHTSTFFTVQDGLLFARDDETFFSCYDTTTGECIFYRNLDLGD